MTLLDYLGVVDALLILLLAAGFSWAWLRGGRRICGALYVDGTMQCHRRRGHQGEHHLMPDGDPNWPGGAVSWPDSSCR